MIDFDVFGPITPLDDLKCRSGGQCPLIIPFKDSTTAKHLLRLGSTCDEVSDDLTVTPINQPRLDGIQDRLFSFDSVVESLDASLMLLCYSSGDAPYIQIATVSVFGTPKSN